MIAELIHRLVSKKLFAALNAAYLVAALVILSIFFADKDTTVAIVTFMGAPAISALVWFVHMQGRVDQAETLAQTPPHE